MDAKKVLDDLKRRFPNEPEYHQAVEEVLGTIEEEYNKHPEFDKVNLIERLCIPDRVYQFRVTWMDDKGQIQTNMGYRIQHNNAIGPYKGGIRFHSSVNLGILKFLAFEQTFKNSRTSSALTATRNICRTTAAGPPTKDAAATRVPSAPACWISSKPPSISSTAIARASASTAGPSAGFTASRPTAPDASPAPNSKATGAETTRFGAPASTSTARCSTPGPMPCCTRRPSDASCRSSMPWSPDRARDRCARSPLPRARCSRR